MVFNILNSLRDAIMKHLTEHELFIINKCVIKNAWCDNSVSEQDLLFGRDYKDLSSYKDAINKLLKKGIICTINVEGNNNYCILKIHHEKIASVLKENVGKYPFINHLTGKYI